MTENPVDLPLGLGSRHLAAASISRRVGAVAIVVSENGVVRVVYGGQIEATLIPELWLLDRHHRYSVSVSAGSQPNSGATAGKDTA